MPDRRVYDQVTRWLESQPRPAGDDAPDPLSLMLQSDDDRRRRLIASRGSELGKRAQFPINQQPSIITGFVAPGGGGGGPTGRVLVAHPLVAGPGGQTGPFSAHPYAAGPAPGGFFATPGVANIGTPAGVSGQAVAQQLRGTQWFDDFTPYDEDVAPEWSQDKGTWILNPPLEYESGTGTPAGILTYNRHVYTGDVGASCRPLSISSGSGHAIFIRGTTTAGVFSGYSAQFNANGWQVTRWDADVPTVLADGPDAFADGDLVAFSATDPNGDFELTQNGVVIMPRGDAQDSAYLTGSVGLMNMTDGEPAVFTEFRAFPL